jgi:hypothetical protein
VLVNRGVYAVAFDTFSLELVCESDGVQDYEFMAALLVFYATSSWRKPCGLARREFEAMSVETLRMKAGASGVNVERIGGKKVVVVLD